MPIHFFLHAGLPDKQPERLALFQVANLLAKAFQRESDTYAFVGNIDPQQDQKLISINRSLNQLDGLLLGPNLISILEFKHYFNPISVERTEDQPEHWPWVVMKRDLTIHRLGKRSPIRQLQLAKHRWGAVFQDLRFSLKGEVPFEAERLEHSINSLLLFYPYLNREAIPQEIEQIDWFHYGSVRQVEQLVRSLTSDVQVSPETILHWAGNHGIGASSWDFMNRASQTVFARLEIIEHKKQGRRQEVLLFNNSTQIIGRVNREAVYDVNLESGSISRPHAMIEVIQGEVRIRDIGSKFGIYSSEGVQIGQDDAVPLAPYQSVYLGSPQREKSCELTYTAPPTHSEFETTQDPKRDLKK